MAILGRLSATLQGIDSNSFADEDERIYAENLLFNALSRIQSPWDIAWNHNWVNASIHGAAKSLIDAGLFKKWVEHGSKPESSESLAKMADADPVLIIKKTGFKNPTDIKNCVVQHVKGPYESLFDYIAADPIRNKEFMDAMECHSKWNMTTWTDTQNWIGHWLSMLVVAKEKFRLKHPEIPDGSLVIEDLPETIAEVEVPNKAIAKQPYNFFTPQPLKGARAYFMHTVLHDWSDEPAIKILRNIAGGMEKGYSKLLIHEKLVANVRPSRRTTTSDIIMLACTASAERTEKEWHELVNAAGLKIVNIWRQPMALDGVIEVDLA
ncbi:hypothetical protein Daesc_006870 [Daldinia eschscholtzii]|uniref:O-methyltransferase C-terminal domain-containing protein n=1 Tax=Daldinia eschscholtzii TaxID=292717 RepID=A0AAX6MIA1_9PEZI